jgi:fumarylacetoacetase
MSLLSWVTSANEPGTDFPLQNLPYGVFDDKGRANLGIAIGEFILDLRRCSQAGFLSPDVAAACSSDSLNTLMGLGPLHWAALRQRITELLTAGSPAQGALEPFLVARDSVSMRLPAAIGDYTDFFASLYHATNAGSMFRPGNPLFPNYKHVPVGYHGRASSIVVSGAPVRRPLGQREEGSIGQPAFGPSRALDYELEIGTFVGTGNRPGEPIPIAEAPSHIFGLCLLNDWSARDIQAWESQPLGPFLSKSFCTTISPWVVPMAALESFRVPAFARPEGDPAPLPYLTSPAEQELGGIDITVEVHISTQKMRDTGAGPHRLSRGNFRDLYWTVAQLLTHHASNGCHLRTGDLLGSGTISGTALESRGCLLEITQRGKKPILLPNGEQRRFLEDGDEIILRGYCERAGAVRVGLGECRGVVTAPFVRN